MDIGSLLIVGAIVSAVVEGIKWISDGKGNLAIVYTIAISLVAGAFYQIFKDTSYWESVLGILASASAVYGLVIKQVLPKQDSPKVE